MILSWARFSLVLALIALGFSAVIFPALMEDGGNGIAAAATVFAISMMVFFYIRFRKFRELIVTRETGHVGELSHKFFGSAASFFSWLFGTLISAFAVLVGLL